MQLNTLTNGRPSTKGKLRAPPARVASDPRVGADDPCVVCGGERSPVAVANEDPFCTTVCCRTFYTVADAGRG